MITENISIPSKTGGLSLSALLIYGEAVSPDFQSDEGIVCEEPPRVLQIVHGMAEHKERYIPFMEYMAERGYVCIAADTRGHGESRTLAENPERDDDSVSADRLPNFIYSDDDLGYFFDDGLNAFMDDIDRVGAYVCERFNVGKRVLLGHSMGSLAVRRYAAEYDEYISALVISGSPSANPTAGIAAFLAGVIGFFKGDRHRSKLLDDLAFSEYGKKFDGDGKFRWLSANEKNVADYDADPLCGFLFTVNGFYVLFKLMKQVYNSLYYNVGNKAMPVLFVSGGDDPCMVSREKFDDAVRFMSDIGYKTVESKVYDGMRHEIFNETDRLKVFGDVADFLERSL